MLLSYLPLLRGWQWRSNVIHPDKAFTIPANGKRTMDEFEYDGWAWAAAVIMNNPLAQLIFGYYDAAGIWREQYFMPYSLYTHNLTAPNPTGAWVSVYDTIHNIYAIVYGTYLPIPFQKKYKFEIMAPATPVTVSSYTSLVVQIVNPEEFKKSLRELSLSPP
jgi:hypothetical protein